MHGNPQMSKEEAMSVFTILLLVAFAGMFVMHLGGHGGHGSHGGGGHGGCGGHSHGGSGTSDAADSIDAPGPHTHGPQAPRSVDRTQVHGPQAPRSAADSGRRHRGC